MITFTYFSIKYWLHYKPSWSSFAPESDSSNADPA